MIFLNTALAASPRYRQTEEPPVSNYEPKTTAYMNAIGVPNDSTATIYGKTGAEVWQLFNSCIMIAKNAGKLGDIYSWHPMFGLAESTLQYNAIDVSKYPINTFSGSWGFSEMGNETNGGASAFLKMNVSIVMALEDSAFTIACNSNYPIGGSEFPITMGARGTNNGYVALVLKRYNTQAIGTIGFYDENNIANVSTSEGISTVSRKSGVLKYTRNESVLYERNVSGGALPNVELHYGAYRNQLSTQLFEKQRLTSCASHKGDDTTVSVVQQMIDTWEAGLNRKTW